MWIISGIYFHELCSNTAVNTFVFFFIFFPEGKVTSPAILLVLRAVRIFLSLPTVTVRNAFAMCAWKCSTIIKVMWERQRGKKINKPFTSLYRVGSNSEKLWPWTWKCCPRPVASGNIFKTSVKVKVFIIRTSQLANNKGNLCFPPRTQTRYTVL